MKTYDCFMCYVRLSVEICCSIWLDPTCPFSHCYNFPKPSTNDLFIYFCNRPPLAPPPPKKKERNKKNLIFINIDLTSLYTIPTSHQSDLFTKRIQNKSKIELKIYIFLSHLKNKYLVYKGHWIFWPVWITAPNPQKKRRKKITIDYFLSKCD